jgi:hypothetical protein
MMPAVALNEAEVHCGLGEKLVIAVTPDGLDGVTLVSTVPPET